MRAKLRKAAKCRSLGCRCEGCARFDFCREQEQANENDLALKLAAEKAAKEKAEAEAKAAAEKAAKEKAEAEAKAAAEKAAKEKAEAEAKAAAEKAAKEKAEAEAKAAAEKEAKEKAEAEAKAAAEKAAKEKAEAEAKAAAEKAAKEKAEAEAKAAAEKAAKEKAEAEAKAAAEKAAKEKAEAEAKAAAEKAAIEKAEAEAKAAAEKAAKEKAEAEAKAAAEKEAKEKAEAEAAQTATEEPVAKEAAEEEKPAEAPVEKGFKLDPKANASVLPAIATKRGRKLIYAPKEALYEVTGIKIDVEGKKNDAGVKVKDILEAEIKEGLKLGYLEKYDGLKTSEIKEEYENDTVWELAEQEFKKMGLLLDGDKVKVYLFDWTGSGCHHVGYLPEDKAAEIRPYLEKMDEYSFDVLGIITGGKSKTVVKDEKTGKITITKGKDGNYGVDLDVTVIKRKD